MKKKSTHESLQIKSDRTMLPDSAPTSLHVGHSDIPFAPHSRNLGFSISSNTTLDKNVKNICRPACAEPWHIGSTRHLLTVNATKTLVRAFVLSKLDYCKSLLSDSPQNILNKLGKCTKLSSKISPEISQAWSFSIIFTGYQYAQELNTRLWLCFSIFTDSSLISLSFWLYTPLPDNTVLPCRHTYSPHCFHEDNII